MADINTLARVYLLGAPGSVKRSGRVCWPPPANSTTAPQQVMARDCVAIVINEMPNPARRTSFTERLLNSAVFEVTRRNLLTEILPVKDLPKLYNGYTKAVLLLLSEKVIEQHFEQLSALSMPILTVNKQYAFSSAVCTDHGEGVRLALEQSLQKRTPPDCRHRRPVFSTRAGRGGGSTPYRAFLSAHGLPELEPVMYTDLERRDPTTGCSSCSNRSRPR